MSKDQSTTLAIVDLVFGLWRRADRDYSSKSARKAFRETCHRILSGEGITVLVPKEDTPCDSAEWAAYVAACDCPALKDMLDRLFEMEKERQAYLKSIAYASLEDSDSDDTFDLPFPIWRRAKRKRTLNPDSDKRFKTNKTSTEIEQQKRQLTEARSMKAEPVATEEVVLPEEPQPEVSSLESSPKSEESSVAYMEKRKKRSKPKKVPIPPLPSDYTKENEWVKENIKSPDMLYSYVLMKTGNGIMLSAGMRKYWENNDFWEFAFDTLASGGWRDSEHNRPIENISKYITKATIGEFERHEATKRSRFEGKFKNGKELLDYINLCCSSVRKELRTEEYCEWFLQKMNDMGWRWGNGATINNIPGEMSRNFPEFQEWQVKNRDHLAGLTPDQYGATVRIHKALEKGEIKPKANGKYSAMDLKKYLVGGQP